MLINEILTPGEKIKKVRKAIGASQQDIAGAKITRNLVSQIENGKTKLVTSTAKIICDNIIEFINKNTIKEFNITPEWLLEDIETQINNIAGIYLNELRKLRISTKNENFKEVVEASVQEVEFFMGKFDISYKLKAEIYEVISDIYFNYKDYNMGILKLQNSLDIITQEKDYEESLRLMLRLSTKVYINGGDALQQLMTMHSALNLYTYNSLNNKDLLKKIYFNFALYYSEINMHDNSIEYLNKLLNEFTLSIKEELDVKLLKANCYEEISEYILAEKMYLDVLDISLKVSNSTVTSKIYNSLGTLYRLMGKSEDSLKYIGYSLQIKDIEERNYAKTLYYALENYIEMNNEELVIKNYSKSLNFIDKIRNGNLYYNLVTKLYDYFNTKQEYEIVFDLLRKIEVNIKRRIITNKDAISLFFKTSYDLKTHNIPKSEEIFEKGILLLENF